MHNMEFKDLVTKSVLQVRRECAFFGALMLFAKIIPSKSIETAATNGKTIFINEEYLLSLSSSEQNGLLLHEVLHMALLHCTRVGGRDRLIWNIAADIVVNDLIQRIRLFNCLMEQSLMMILKMSRQKKFMKHF